MEPLDSPNVKRQEHWLPVILTGLCVAQPLLDVLSYWTQTLGGSSAIPLMLRMLVLATTVLVAFVLSDRKRAYWILGGVLVLFWVAHAAACIRVGYENPVSDLVNYVRVAQFPLYTFSLITLFRHVPRFLEVAESACTVNLFLIAGVTLVSVLTGTCMPTYFRSQIGWCGWFSLPNSQSAILGVLTVIALLSAVRCGRRLLAALCCAVGFALLFLLGTRLAYAEIFCIALGSCIYMLLTRHRDARILAVILACAVLSGLLYHQSPMYQNRQTFADSVTQQQQTADAMRDSGASSLDDLYQTYQPVMVSRFGLEAVEHAFGYTDDISILGDTRLGKILYCRMVLEELPVTSRLFGFELEATVCQGAIFDAENDFHGVYFLYGLTGLLLMIGFLLWFAGHALWCLLRNPARYFTLPVCAFGMAALILVVNAYFSASVLRRPNASVYLSISLAALYCLTARPLAEGSGREKGSP